MDHAEKAKALFLEGYNCAQSVFGAFCDVTGMDFEQAMKLASSFGGGMGGRRETCGTCTGAFMVLGIAKDIPILLRLKKKENIIKEYRNFPVNSKKRTTH